MKRDEVQAILREATEVVEAARIPEELREVAFSEAVALLSGTRATQGRGTADAATSDISHENEGGDGDDSLGQIASALDISSEQVGDVYHIEGDELELVVPHGSVSSQKKAGTEQLALLVVAGLQASGIADWVSLGTVREVIDDFGRRDEANFSRTIKNMKQFRQRGSGAQKELKLRKPGLKEAGELIQNLTES